MTSRSMALRRTVVPILAMLALTAAFGWFVWLGTGAYLAWFGTLADVTPTWATALVVQPWLPFPFHAIVLQLVAVASLAANCAWTHVRMRRAHRIDPALLPIACHVAVIVACLCLAGAGMLAPLVEVAAVLR